MAIDRQRIVSEYSDMLYRIAMHYTKNTSDARDIVQQVFFKLVEKNPRFSGCDHEKAWLIRVCINLCKDLLKSSWHQKVSTGQEYSLTCRNENMPEEGDLLEYIRKLPAKQRTAIYLFYYEDMPVKEIAAVMKSRQNTVLSWLSRGRKSLEKMLKEEL